MMQLLGETYSGAGLVLLIASSLAWGLSHILVVSGLSKGDFYSRILGFVTFISIFIVSGWRAGFISLVFILPASLAGAVIARGLRGRK